MAAFATGARMSDLLVIDVSVKEGKGHVVLADKAHDPRSARLITMEFPLDGRPFGPYTMQEEQIVRDAQAVLREATAALRER